MSDEPTLQDLEKALMERARRLAEEYMERARATREHMIRDENERLRIQEEREVLAAELAADRLYRSKVQSTEMELRSELDHKRWEMVQELKGELLQRCLEYSRTEAYPALLKGFLKSAVESLNEEDELVAQLCQHDFERFSEEWESWIHETVPGARLELSDSPGDFSGGIIVRDRRNSVRVDHSFEGRMERLDEELNLVLTVELFPAVLEAMEAAHE